MIPMYWIFFPTKFPFVILPNCAVYSQVRKLKGSEEHLGVERTAGGQDVLVSR